MKVSDGGRVKVGEGGGVRMGEGGGVKIAMRVECSKGCKDFFVSQLHRLKLRFYLWVFMNNYIYSYRNFYFKNSNH